MIKTLIVTWWIFLFYPAVHDDVIKWKHFPRYWPFLRGIHRSSVISPHKGQWRGALMFSLICSWIYVWVSNGGAGDLRRDCAHCDVTVMELLMYLINGWVEIIWWLLKFELAFSITVAMHHESCLSKLRAEPATTDFVLIMASKHYFLKPIWTGTKLSTFKIP